MKLYWKKNETYLYMLLVCSFISFNFLPINIVYPFGALLIFSGIISLLQKKLVMKKITAITIIFITVFSVSQSIGLLYNPGKNITILPVIIFIYSWVISIFILETPPIIDKEQRKKIYIKVIHLSIIFFIIELLTRISIYQEDKTFLYSFKKSLLYFDSNFAGLVIISILSFSFYLKKRLLLNTNKEIIILTLLTFLTMSRGAMFVAILLPFLFLGKYFKTKLILSLMIVLSTFIYMATNYILMDTNYVSIDGSFNSKFYILKKSLYFFESLPMESKLFGIGLGNTESSINIYAHNIIATLLLEFGIIGSLLFLLFIIYSVIKSKCYSLFIWVPTIIAGISLFGAYSPFIFIINSVILFEENNNEK
ncbi:O-antigen ligase family protein [Morganella morganii]|nr:O-antigen ligase family protein [Morganella morganii]